MESDKKFALKPYPCCGGHSTIEHGAEQPDNGWVVCMECGLHTRYYTDPAKATAEWNRRANCGNAAAMREALVALEKSGVLSYNPSVVCGQSVQKKSYDPASRWCKCCDDGMRAKCRAIWLARAALSAPARQCDVGTAEEQTKMFSDFCVAHRHTDLPRCAGCPLENTQSDTGCSFAWAQTPYEAEEGAGE